MNRRDKEYIVKRLNDPARPAVEAAGRLRQTGFNEEANQILRATRIYTQICRAVKEKALAKE